MKSLEEVIDKDERIQEMLGNTLDIFPEKCNESKFPFTSKLLFNICYRTNEIKEGIFDNCYSDNYYSCQILFRSLIEHHLTFMYINYRFINDDNDEIGRTYYEERAKEEEINYWEATLKMAKLMKRNDIFEEGKKTIYDERFPNLKEISRKKLTDLNLHFKVNQIIAYFLKDIDFENIDEDKDYPELGNLRYLTDFVQLSSFVHGGPLAEQLISKYKNKEKRTEKLLNSATAAFAMANGCYVLTLIYMWKATKDEKYLKLSNKINEFISPLMKKE